DPILQDLSHSDISVIASTGSVGYRMVSDFGRRAYQIELFLSPFFTAAQYLSFRELQASTDMLITRYIALHFLDRTSDLNVALDIVVHCDFGFDIHQFLLTAGYTF
ncbi:uncharacterized protein EV420DRAFT_1221530, partial [Desarmillaria tabescens]